MTAPRDPSEVPPAIQHYLDRWEPVTTEELFVVHRINLEFAYVRRHHGTWYALSKCAAAASKIRRAP
jgi:hypothetical protein